MLSSTVIAYLLTALAVSATPTRRNNGGGKGQDTTLDGLAQKTKRYIGTATNAFNIQGTNPGGAYVSVLESDFRGALTAENEGKWEVIHPALNTYNFTGMDVIVAEAKKIGGIVRGHNFVWHQQTPAYVTSITDPAQLKSVYQAHVDNVAGRYKNDWAYLDVINEPFFDNGTLRDSVWYNVLGEDYFEYTLRYVHQVAPHIKLCINDYNIESVGPKSKALAALAKKLLAKGVPLHCIGFESHFVGGQLASNSDIAASMKQFTDMGLEVPLTELDVRIKVDGNDKPLAQSELQTQATDYGNSVKTCFENPLCPGVTVWQFYDPVSWIPGVFPGEGAADLYDASYGLKPAYYAVRDTIKAAAANAKFKGKKI